MRGDVAARLREAMSTGEVLGIRYHGGSQPGAYRQIVPIRIEGDQVRARCYTSNAVKVFAMAKIEMCDAAAPTEADAAAAWTPLPEVAHRFTTLSEIAAHVRPRLEAKGWHVEHGPTEEGERLAVYARFKNGKARRTPAVLLTYEPRTYDIIETAFGLIERRAERPRVRPWTLQVGGKSSSFGRVDRVVQALMLATGLSAADEAATRPERDRAPPADVVPPIPASVAVSTTAARSVDPAQSPPTLIRRAWQWLRLGPRGADAAGA